MAPLISSVSYITEVRLGMPAVLVCLVTGYTLPSIVWRKDGEEFSNSSRVNNFESSSEKAAANGSSFQASGWNGCVADLLMMHTSFTVDQVLQLGELGVVGLLSFEETVRGDTANYTCTAANSLPETTMLKTISSNILLAILGMLFSLSPIFIIHFLYTERPDPPVSVTASDYGARWIALHWTSSFDGNRPVTSVSLYIRSVDVSNNFTLIRSLNANDLMTSEGNLSYNVSDGTIILPQTRYSFTVVSCNEIGCSDQSDPSPVVTTLRDGMIYALTFTEYYRHMLIN